MDTDMKKPLCLLLLAFFSCASTVHVDRAVQSSTGIGKQADPASAVVAVPIEMDPPAPVVIEKPIFIPQGSPSPAPAQGRAAVEAANRAIVTPQEYSNSAMVYDYDRDFVYELYCQPFRVSDITLQPGEKANEPPFVSDSERWMLGAGVSHESGVPVQHFYVKPTEANLTASLIINTDVRVYHLILRSFRDVYMPIVRWRYHNRDMPQNYAGAKADQGPGPASQPQQVQRDDEPALSPDPRNLSFNYKITYGVFRKPRWLPTLAYDDGRKTYVTFPDLVLTMELPSVFENRADVVNYRVYQNVMIIDKLIEKITIKLGDRIATVEKKKGKP
jgi:type IV secretion system protein TrbG